MGLGWVPLVAATAPAGPEQWVGVHCRPCGYRQHAVLRFQHNFLGTLTVVIGQEHFGNVHVYVLLTLLELLYLLQILDLLPPAGPRRVSKCRRSGVVTCVISYAALACYGLVA